MKKIHLTACYHVTPINRSKWPLAWRRGARGVENDETKKSFLPLRLCGEKIRNNRELTARFARGAECAEIGKRQTLFNYQKYLSDKIKNAFVLPLRPLRLCGENFGFSLIEVLVATAVMIIIVLMVTNMFRNASEAWDTGSQRAEMNTAARCAVEYISRELSCAVAGSIPDSAGSTITLKRFKLGQNAEGMTDNLSFIALSGDDQSLRGIRFRYQDNIIEICRKTDSDFVRYDDYDWDQNPNNKDNWQGVALLITNVWRFEVTVCSNESDMMAGGVGYAYDSSAPANANLLPACVDISIEMLNERDMTRALSLTTAAQQDGYVMTNSRVYTTRVYFPNRGGAR